MASVVSEDENSDDNFSDFSQYSLAWEENMCERSENDFVKLIGNTKPSNVTTNIFNRQLYGRFAKTPRAKTERIFDNIHTKCRFALNSLIKDPDAYSHIFMGFTMCGQYFLSYTEKMYEDLGPLNFNTTYEYELYLWKFIPGQKLICFSKHKIFKHLKGSEVLDKIMFMQFPKDMYKIVCYGLAATNPDLVYISILTIPSPKSCKHCNGNFLPCDESVNQGWCVKHGFIIHYMLSMSQPTPTFDPNISLAYPNHLVINTGHHIHILNVSTSEPPQVYVSLQNLKDEDLKLTSQTPTHTFNDTLSEVSESPSEHFGSSSIVDAILEDFSEYDLESSECNKPFHELNISCEPLNVTGKSYHNTLVQNIVDPRLKRLQTTSKDYLFSVPQGSGGQKPVEKTKIDKKIAEKAYEFIEENEKYEKISSFRKKRLAEKKYEFSEDNSENIVPFNSLRRERRYLYRSQNRCIRSPDFNSLFLSPRSSGLRSPMQSPNSRNGQFSPSGARNLYCPSVRNSPHHSKSPISPKDSARKFYVYSPSLDSDCSDSDSRLILRTSNISTSIDNRFNSNGLLIVDPKMDTPKWIKKVVRRYSNGDFENSSLVSGQSRDDYNIPIEIPLLVQSLTEQHLDVIPESRVDQVTEMQLIVTQRSFDCEQFVQRRAQKLCSEAHLEFLHCDDYDIKIIHICPVNGHIICQAVIKIGALKKMEPYGKPENFTASFLFTWSIETDAFDVIELKEPTKLLPSNEPQEKLLYEIPKNNFSNVLIMDYYYTTSKSSLRDYNNYYEVCLGSANIPTRSHMTVEYSSDSD
ncbi:uncharacterized protein LOC108914464 [Anoplophora glabripennis]|uniref:uncharacterized protein LOC108914464 n=1 Tax=Anoplophora glabripennis TaxID=217634 RepID=UPI0008745DD9|nr:uncharacterized protein LOC108914464 [Anoplophora glabripennis]